MGEHDLFIKGMMAGIEGGKGGLDFIVAAGDAMFGPDDPDSQFYRWLRDNRGNLEQAAHNLGIEVGEGPDFARRLRDAYIATLGV